MDINDLMKLVNAGFTKDEILALNGNTPTPTREVTEGVVAIDDSTKSVETVTDAPKENKETKEATPQATNVNFAPMMTDAQIEKLAQMLNRGSASIDLPQAKPIEETLGEHFKDLMNGTN